LSVRWLADECVAAPLVEFLRSLAHDVRYVAESASGLSDMDVIELASSEKRILLTEDKVRRSCLSPEARGPRRRTDARRPGKFGTEDHAIGGGDRTI
jgi:hypothetical protein